MGFCDGSWNCLESLYFESNKHNYIYAALLYLLSVWPDTGLSMKYVNICCRSY